MPLRVNLGLSQKVGLPDYGSLGASCNVEIELDAGLLQNDVESFHKHVRNAYAACRQAVQEELAGHAGSSSGRSTPSANRLPQPSANGNGHEPSSKERNGHAHHRISQKQAEYATQLAGQIEGLGVRQLDALTQKMFGKPLVELSSLNGSCLIDTLKEMKAGRLNVEAALRGAPP
jgi:hypothetical protein